MELATFCLRKCEIVQRTKLPTPQYKQSVSSAMPLKETLKNQPRRLCSRERTRTLCVNHGNFSVTRPLRQRPRGQEFLLFQEKTRRRKNREREEEKKSCREENLKGSLGDDLARPLPLDAAVETASRRGRWWRAVSAITLTDLDCAAGLICRHKMINDKYQALLCRALMSARKE